MDRAMHAQWLRAERRLDSALAGLAACALWMVCLPLTVVFTDLTWSQQVGVALLLAIPVGFVFFIPLVQGVTVVRAIEERDADEVQRWQATGVPPLNPDLLQARQRRVHTPLLTVVALSNAMLIVVAIPRAIAPRNPAEALYAPGVAGVAIGVALTAVIFMLSGRIKARLQAILVAAVTWTVPVGVSMCAAALLLHQAALTPSGVSGAFTSVVFVIFGIMLALTGLALVGAWLVMCGRAFSGRGVGDSGDQRARVSLMVAQLVGATHKDQSVADQTGDLPPSNDRSEPEFEPEDLAIIDAALDIELFDVVFCCIVLAMSVAILILNATGLAGGALHGLVAILLLVSIIVLTRRVRSLLHLG